MSTGSTLRTEPPWIVRGKHLSQLIKVYKEARCEGESLLEKKERKQQQEQQEQQHSTDDENEGE